MTMTKSFTLGDQAGNELPTTMTSLEEIKKDRPKALGFITRHDALDLSEMIFGEAHEKETADGDLATEG